MCVPRWKSTEQILNLSKDGEIFDENWMDYDSIYQYAPPSFKWTEKRKIKFEDVDIWEVLFEWSGLSGVYAAWCPYAHYFIITDHWTIIKEFWGIQGEKDLQKYLTKINVPFSLNNIWVDDDEFTTYLSETENKLIIP